MENYEFEPDNVDLDAAVPKTEMHKVTAVVLGVLALSMLPLIGFYFGAQYGASTQRQVDAVDTNTAPEVDEVSEEEVSNEVEDVPQNDTQPRRLNVLKNLTAADLDDGVINDEVFEFSWAVTDDVLNTFPLEYTYVSFNLYDMEGNQLAAIGDGFLLGGKSSYRDGVSRLVRDDLVNATDSYILKATLVVQPNYFECDPLVKGECSPVYGDEDNRLRELSSHYSNESVPFTFDSALWQNINRKASVSIDGPTEVVLGEENVWTATIQNDGDNPVDLSCYVSRWQTGMNEIQVGPDGEPVPYTYSSWNEKIYASELQTGDVASLVWVPTETSEGDIYFEISCTPWEEGGSLPGDGASVQFEVVE